jgi:NADH-quinone oxidoreductase subunit M
MGEIPWLSIMTFLPTVVAVGLWFINDEDPDVIASNVRGGALLASLATLAIAFGLWTGYGIFNHFDPATHEFQFVENREWFGEGGFAYHMGVDGISLFFVLLSAFLTPLCILASWTAIKTRVKEYMIAFLVLETLMIGMFCALDIVLFYVFFEGVLIPMFIIIGVWGGPRRVYAAFKFFLYTLLGSVLMLLAIIAMYYQAGTTDIPALMAYGFPRDMQIYMWLAFFASFAVKVPMWPVHTWLPDAHVEAPTAGSVILAGVLLKMGGYGFLRFSVPMMPEASAYFTPFVYGLSIVAVIYTSLVALAQTDMKKLIAYSSVAHMGFVTVGIFAMNQQAVSGAIFQMLSHGVVSGALFLIVGVVYARMHSREISSYGGLVHRMPRYAAVFMLFMLASVGLPGTSGFVGELLVMVGAFQANTWVAALIATGMILGAAYMLYLYRRVIFGALVKDELKSILDLDRREILVFAPLVVAVLWMGIFPMTFLGPIEASVANLIENYQTALAAAGSVPDVHALAAR